MSIERALASAPSAAIAAGHVHDRKPQADQHLSRERRDFLVVFDQQHLTTAAPHRCARLMRLMRLRPWAQLAACNERGSSSVTIVPVSDLAFDREPTARLLRETVDLRQAQSRSLADVLGSEEWLEHARQDLGRHPLPVSATESLTKSAGRPSSPLPCRFSAAMVMVPPPGIASRAFTHRFSIANSNSPTSISTGHSSAPNSISTWMCPPSERSSISRMPLSWAARSIDSGLMGWRRENASSWCVSPVPRATARRIPARTRSRCSAADVALQQLQAVREHRQQIVEVVCHAAGQLADRFQLLRLAKRLLGIPQPLLVAQALGDVIHELVRTDALAVAIAQGAVAHLVERGDPSPDHRIPRSP